MKNIDDLDYTLLTSIERANMTIAALARNDDQEVARLRRSCPRIAYVGLDREYAKRFLGLLDVFVQFSGICLYHTHQIKISDLCILNYSILNTHPQYLYIDSPAELEKLREARIGHMSYLKSAYAALVQFCLEVNLNHKHVTSWLKLEPISRLSTIQTEDTLSEISPDKDFTETVKQILLETWNKELE